MTAERTKPAHPHAGTRCKKSLSFLPRSPVPEQRHERLDQNIEYGNFKDRIVMTNPLVKACCFGMFLFFVPINSLAEEGRPAFDFQNAGPVQFLEFLKSHSNPRQTYVMDEEVQGWISEEDIPELIRLLDSEEACMSVKSASSSYVPGRSKIGYEAAFLIDGFRTGFYPPRLNSKPVTDLYKSEIRTWWRQSMSSRTHAASDKPSLTRKRFYHSQFGHRSSQGMGPRHLRYPHRSYRKTAQTVRER